MSVTEKQERDLNERIALVFESAGLAPIACRIVARLLTCDPAEQSSTELADWLGASKGSISTQTQVLVRAGFVRRTRRSGSRAVWYALQPHLWSDMFAMEVVRTQRMLALGEEACELKRAGGQPVDDRLRDFIGFCRFFQERLPALIAEWHAVQAASREAVEEMP
jgi:DNA-binding transcriptional regulator GbsR (MarR family)